MGSPIHFGILVVEAQRAQWPSTKEYTVNDIEILKVYSLIEGYWALWEGRYQSPNII